MLIFIAAAGAVAIAAGIWIFLLRKEIQALRMELLEFRQIRNDLLKRINAAHKLCETALEDSALLSNAEITKEKQDALNATTYGWWSFVVEVRQLLSTNGAVTPKKEDL